MNAYTMYHVPCTTFISHHVMSHHVMSCHVMHSYHIPYIPCTIYHVPLVFMSSTLPNLSLLYSTPLYSKCTSTVSLPSNACISQLCIDSISCAHPIPSSYPFIPSLCIRVCVGVCACTTIPVWPFSL